MIRFTKGDNETSRFKINFAAFLAGEATGATITAITDTVVVSGDVAMGTGAGAPTIVDAGAAIQFRCSGGTANTSTIWEFRFTISTGDSFDRRCQMYVFHEGM